MGDPASAVENLVRQYNTADLSEARMFRKIAREIRPRVSINAYLVLMFIFDRTYTFGKTAEAIPVSHFLEGVRLGDGQILIPGVGISRSAMFRGIKELVDNVIITTGKAGRTGTVTYAINPAWTPASPAQRLASIHERLVSITGETSQYNYKNITHEYEQVAPALTREAIAGDKEMQARDALMAAVAGATEKSHAARTKKKSKLSVTGLEKIWEDAFNDAYPDDTFFRWRVFEQSAFANAVGRGVPRSEVQAFIDFAVRSFDNVINNHFSWMKSKPSVSVGFVTKHVAEFYQSFIDDRDPNRKIKRRIREAPAVQAPAKEDNDVEVAALKAQVAKLEAAVGKAAIKKRDHTRSIIRNRPTTGEFGKWDDDD